MYERLVEERIEENPSFRKKYKGIVYSVLLGFANMFE